MRQRSSLLDGLVSGLRQRVLAEFLVGPPRALFRSELARKLGVSASSLQAPLRALTQAGILRAVARGREVFYEVNPDNPVLPDLRGLLVKTAGLADVVRDALSPLRPRIRVAFVFGSFATGAETGASDVDLLVVGDVKLSELSPPLRVVEARLGRPVNVVSLTPAELRRKARSDHFIRSVLDESKLFLVGTQHELEATLGEGAGGAARDEPRGDREPAKRGGEEPR